MCVSESENVWKCVFDGCLRSTSEEHCLTAAPATSSMPLTNSWPLTSTLPPLLPHFLPFFPSTTQRGVKPKKVLHVSLTSVQWWCYDDDCGNRGNRGSEWPRCCMATRPHPSFTRDSSHVTAPPSLVLSPNRSVSVWVNGSQWEEREVTPVSAIVSRPLPVTCPHRALRSGLIASVGSVAHGVCFCVRLLSVHFKACWCRRAADSLSYWHTF